MSCMAAAGPYRILSLWQTAAQAAVGIIAFHLAYSFSTCSFLILVYLFSLAALARQRTSRRAFYFGLVMGLLAYGPQLWCFYTIFGPAAVALWGVLAFWLAVFGVLARGAFHAFGPRWAVVLVPFVWTGLEYFRSEIYYLRFSWLNAGYAFSDHTHGVPFGLLGVYGVGFVLMLLAVALNLLPLCRGGADSQRTLDSTARGDEPLAPRSGGTTPLSLLSRKKLLAAGFLALAGLGLWTNFAPSIIPPKLTHGLSVAGVQMEFPSDTQVLFALNKLKQQFPEAQVLVLSEYTFIEALPDNVKAWCRKNQRYLVVGGKDLLGETNFFDTAFVIDPKGEIVFRQAKSVPIQFFKDGLPAREQKLWQSPWGKIGICICYDLSYTKVTDQLVRLGAQALIVPTMDVVDWGRRQHELHARIAPVRAAEYGLSIFRVASSGISQLVDARGAVATTAPFPGEDAPIAGRLDIAEGGRVPLDRFLARASVWVTGTLVAWLALDALRKRIFK